jgi:D-alanine-D-alanine ligase
LTGCAATVAPPSGEGENGAVQNVLEMLRVPYVGTDPRACRRAWDKPTAKAELVRAGLATPDWVVLPHSTFRELGAQAVLDAMVDWLGLPLMLKPDQGGSALGAQVVREAAELPAAMVGCLAYGDTVLAERFVPGVEVAVAVIDGPDGPMALPAVEIAAEHGVYDYTARYTAGFTTFHAPARLDPDVAERVGSLAVSAHRLLGLRDVSRTDMIVDASGEPQFLEVNVSPGLTETSLLPMAVRAAGMSLGEVFAGLVERAVNRGSAKYPG